jgi:hypothetical protein
MIVVNSAEIPLLLRRLAVQDEDPALRRARRRYDRWVSRIRQARAQESILLEILDVLRDPKEGRAA